MKRTKTLSLALALTLALGLFPKTFAAPLKAVYGAASFSEIAVGTYSRRLEFENGVVVAANPERKYGLIDASGQAVVPFRYAYISALGGGLFLVSDSADSFAGAQGIIDAAGREVLPMRSGQRISCANDTISVRDTEAMTTVYYTLTMQPASESAYFGRGSGSADAALADYSGWQETSYGYIVWNAGAQGTTYAVLDRNFQTLIEPGIYNQISADTHDRPVLYVTAGGRSGVIGYSGETLVPMGNYRMIGRMNRSGYITATSYDLSGGTSGTMLNLTAEVYQNGAVVQTFHDRQLDTVYNYDGFLFAAPDSGSFGLMRMDGSVVLQEKYARDAITADEAGNLLVYALDGSGNRRFGLYAPDGRVIFPESYTEISWIGDELYLLGDGSNYGIRSSAGADVFPMTYRDMKVYSTNFIELYDGNYYSVVDLRGKQVLPVSSRPIEVFQGFGLGAVGELLAVDDYALATGDTSCAVQPFIVTTGDGEHTYYVNYKTGEVEGDLPYPASNIDDDGLFVYRSANGLYGIGALGDRLPEPAALPTPTPVPLSTPAPAASPDPAPQPTSEVTLLPNPSPAPGTPDTTPDAPPATPAAQEQPGNVFVPGTPQTPAEPADPTPNIPSSWATGEVYSAISDGLVPVSLRGNYRHQVTRAEVAQMFVNLLEKSTGKTISSLLAERGLEPDYAAFTDTSDSAALSMNALGIMTAMSPGSFGPDSPLSRAQIAAIINRVASVVGIITTGYPHDFTDVAGHWVDAELGWPVSFHIIEGRGNHRFDPDTSLTAEEAILITYRAYKVFRP